MPPGYPDFPSRDQVCDYLNAYVDSFGCASESSWGPRSCAVGRSTTAEWQAGG
jgi:hypothetical protein